MVEVVAAQEVLVCLAVARVLRDDHPGHRLEHFAGTEQGLLSDRVAGHRALAGGVPDADFVFVAADDLNTGKRGGSSE